jgi:hypothetical protein
MTHKGAKSDMEAKNAYSRRVFARIMFFMLLACLAVNGAAFWALKAIIVKARDPAGQATALLSWAKQVEGGYWIYGLPGSIVFFILLGLFFWGLSRRYFSKHILPALAAKTPAKRAPKVEDARLSAEANQRFFVHLITVLQREGRLLDFFSEDLQAYGDDQIGAAVRSIHENCKRAMEKYLALTAVVKENEGDEITVEENFDPNLLKLTGNVTGKPPFKGTIRHRGWRIRKIELPTFAGKPDPAIIAPAEVEIR